MSLIKTVSSEWNPLVEQSEGNKWALEVQENTTYAKYVPDNLYFENSSPVSLAFRTAIAASWAPGALFMAGVQHLAVATYFYKQASTQEKSEVPSGKQEESEVSSKDIDFQKEAMQWGMQGAKELTCFAMFFIGTYMSNWWLPLGLMGLAALYPRSGQLGLHYGQQLIQCDSTLSPEQVAKYSPVVKYFVEHNIDLGLLAHCLRLDAVTVNTKQKTD